MTLIFSTSNRGCADEVVEYLAKASDHPEIAVDVEPAAKEGFGSCSENDRSLGGQLSCC